MGVQENVKPNGGQTTYAKGTTGEEFGLVGEKYGWMVEVDPQDPNFRPRKHTSLGRFRHENVAFRAEAGRKLVVDLLQKKYVLSLKICSSLGQTLNYWVDWHLLKLAQPARS